MTQFKGLLARSYDIIWRTRASFEQDGSDHCLQKLKESFCSFDPCTKLKHRNSDLHFQQPQQRLRASTGGLLTSQDDTMHKGCLDEVCNISRGTYCRCDAYVLGRREWWQLLCDNCPQVCKGALLCRGIRLPKLQQLHPGWQACLQQRPRWDC